MKRVLLFRINCAILVLACFLFSVLPASSQTAPIKNPGQFLYTKFARAKVATKVGNDLNMILNYNVVTEVFVFMQKGNMYDLIDYHNVDTIYLNGSVFIPGEKVFYELVLPGKTSLLVRHRGSIQDPPKPAAYGGTSEVSSSNYISNVQIGNLVYRLQQDTTLLIKQSEEYLVGMEDKVYPFKTEKQFMAIFPEFKSELKVFIRQNKIRFDQPADLTKLVNYCNSLKK